MSAVGRHTRFVVAGVLAAAVPYVAGVVLLARHAASGEAGVYAYWRDPLLGTMTFAVVGALIRVRRPGNRVGHLLAAIGVLSAMQLFTGEYHAYAAHVAPGLPSGEQAASLSEVAQVGVFSGYLLLLQIFPDVQLLGRRWRLVTAFTAIALSVGLVSVFIDMAEVAFQIFFLAPYSVAVLGSFGAPVVRWRRGDGRVRAQMKWVAFAAVAAVVLVLTGALGAWSDTVALILVPAATVVAILRYRLFDIDRLISRTFLLRRPHHTAARPLPRPGHHVGAATPRRLFRRRRGLHPGGRSLFQPLRLRLQNVVDRRFNRARYDAERTVAAFTVQLRQEVDLDTVRSDLLTVVHDTLQPTGTSLWLRR